MISRRPSPALFLVSLLILAGCAGEPGTAVEEFGVEEAPEEGSNALRSLPYAAWVPLEEGENREGVTRWIPDRTAPGVTLFTPRHEARALLVDLAGRTRHAWEAELLDDDSPVSPPSAWQGSWQHVELLPGGDLVVVIKDRLLARIGWDSEPVWTIEGRFHHDAVFVSPHGERGRLWALDRHERLVPYAGGEVPVLTDRVLEIDAATGQALRTVDLWPALHGFVEDRLGEVADWVAEQGGRAAIGRLLPDTPPDLLHTNSVVELDRDVPGLGKKGDLLLSIRHLNRVVVVDLHTGALGWVWGEEAGLDGQHHATVLSNGHVLLFDNGRERGWSRVLEVDPASRRIVWTYRAASGEDTFWSLSRGAAQRLANGNTLVTESDFGRLFEVTPQGEIVWEYLAAIDAAIDAAIGAPTSPDAGADSRPARAAIYRAARIEGALLDSLGEALRRSRAAERPPAG